MKNDIISSIERLMTCSAQTRKAVKEVVSGKKSIKDLSDVVLEGGGSIESLLSDRSLKAISYNLIYYSSPREKLDLINHMLSLGWNYSSKEELFLLSLRDSILDRKKDLSPLQYEWLTHIIVHVMKEMKPEFRVL